MLSRNSVLYRFLCISWVLVTMVPRNSTARIDGNRRTRTVEMLNPVVCATKMKAYCISRGEGNTAVITAFVVKTAEGIAFYDNLSWRAKILQVIRT